MKRNLFGRIAFLVLAMVSAQVTFAQFRVVGYMPSWAGSVNSIQYSKLTHINYAFALPNSSGGISPIENPSKLQSLVANAHANGVKVLIAVGGWNDGNDSGFEGLASSAGTRTNFVNTMISFVNQYNLDGVDIDWEYPDNGQSANNYLSLMTQLSTEMHNRGKLLTAAVVGTGGGSILNGVFNVVDFLNLMAYDFNSFDHSTYNYATQSLNYWRGRGLPKEKAVLGVPFYGRPTWESFAQLVARGANPNADVFQNVGYNGLTTIRNKTNLAFDQGNGIMIWELSQDATGGNSLLSAIYEVKQNHGGNPNPNPGTPFTIQAEAYSNMLGVQTEATTDAGGGSNVGWIETGDWMAWYNINFPTSGSYKVEYRVASLSGGGRLSLDLNAGSIQLGALDVPNTGGWQNWTTISHNVNITAGTYNLGLFAQASGWNINWIRITPPAGAAPVRVAMVDQMVSNSIAAGNAFNIAPNPVIDQLTIFTNEDLKGGLLRVYDMTGKQVMTARQATKTVSVGSLAKGVYTLVYTNGDKKIIKQFIK